MPKSVDIHDSTDYRLWRKRVLLKCLLVHVLTSCSSPTRSGLSHSKKKKKTRKPRKVKPEVIRRLRDLFADQHYFEMRTAFTVGLFRRDVVAPLARFMDGELTSSLIRKAPLYCELPNDLRVLRWLLYCRGARMMDVAWEFGQSLAQTNKDVYYIMSIAGYVLSDQVIKLIEPASREYSLARGGGNFADFPQAVYAGDGMHVKIRRPKKRLREMVFYDKKHKTHSVNFIMFADGAGRIRSISGPFVGSANDITAYRTSIGQSVSTCVSWLLKLLLSHTHTHHRWLRPGDKILFDGIMRQSMEEFIVPRRAHRKGKKGLYQKLPMPPLDREHDREHGAARVVIEHVFGKMKRVFPVLEPFRGRQKYMGMTVRAVAWLTTVRHYHLSPVRWTQCQPDNCCCGYLDEDGEIAEQDCLDEDIMEVLSTTCSKISTVSLSSGSGSSSSFVPSSAAASSSQQSRSLYSQSQCSQESSVSLSPDSSSSHTRSRFYDNEEED